MKLFDVPKVGLFLDTITHGSEKRDDEDVKVITLTLRVPDLTPQLAGVLPDGVRSTVFTASKAQPKQYLKRIDFKLGVPAQQLTVYAAPDHPAAAIAFNQCEVKATYARADKDSTVIQFLIKVSFGPVSAGELQYVEDWRLNQRWVTFEESEPDLFEGDGDTRPREDDQPLQFGGDVH